MGRTVPTFVDCLRQAEATWAKFRRVLRREDQPYFDRLFHQVRYYSPAAMYQAHDFPMEAILLCMLLSHEKRIAAMEQVLRDMGLLSSVATETLELPFADGAEPPAAEQ